MSIFITQVLLGITLFFILNWIGKHSYSIGYMELSIFVKADEAPAFNFAIRVLTPVIFIIIASSVFYYFNLDEYTHNIYLVCFYYLTFRLLFNLATSRGLLLNWYAQFLQWLVIGAMSYFTYEKIIKIKTNILPDFTTIANELWLIIFVFLFHVINNVQTSSEATIKRKKNYLKSRYYKFNTKYGAIIKETTKNEILESIAYAILTYEDFNRPKIIRFIENLRFGITKKPHTLGVMQVKTWCLITDEQSVKMGAEKIVLAHQNHLSELKRESIEKTNEEASGHLEHPDFPEYLEYLEHRAISEVISNYNAGNSYVNEVSELTDDIKKAFYRHTKDTLIALPTNKTQ